jgi:hypothetical protein
VTPGREQGRDSRERGGAPHRLHDDAHGLPPDLDVVLPLEVLRTLGPRFALPERGEEDSGLLAGLEEPEGREEEEKTRAQQVRGGRR